MAEAQLLAQNKRVNPQTLYDDCKLEVKKKQKMDGRSKHKSPSMLLHLTPKVTLAIWREKDIVKMQIDDGGKKINIPPDVWRILHLSAEAITLLLSFIEGEGGIADYYDAYYRNSQTSQSNGETQTGNESSKFCSDSSKKVSS